MPACEVTLCVSDSLGYLLDFVTRLWKIKLQIK